MLNPDFKEFLQSLNARDVRYLVVGGYAVAFHGHPRYTKDLDVWIDSSPDNAQRLLLALTDFGFGSVGLEVSDFTQPDRIVQLGYEPARIDLITTLSGIDFSACFPLRVVVDIDGVPTHFIDVESLKKNKRASGRTQDMADLEQLE